MSATEFKDNIWYWRLAIYKAANGAFIVALGAVIAALSGVKWSLLDGQSRFLLVAGVTLSVAKSVDMLFDRTMSDLRDNQPTVQPPAGTPAPGPAPAAPPQP